MDNDLVPAWWQALPKRFVESTFYPLNDGRILHMGWNINLPWDWPLLFLFAAVTKAQESVTVIQAPMVQQDARPLVFLQDTRRLGLHQRHGSDGASRNPQRYPGHASPRRRSSRGTGRRTRRRHGPDTLACSRHSERPDLRRKSGQDANQSGRLGGLRLHLPLHRPRREQRRPGA